MQRGGGEEYKWGKREGERKEIQTRFWEQRLMHSKRKRGQLLRETRDCPITPRVRALTLSMWPNSCDSSSSFIFWFLISSSLINSRWSRSRSVSSFRNRADSAHGQSKKSHVLVSRDLPVCLLVCLSMSLSSVCESASASSFRLRNKKQPQNLGLT